jgi:DnaK suppressor protein
MTELTAEAITIYKQQLLDQQQVLLSLKKTGSDATRTVELDQTSVGRLSRMDALQGQAMSKERERRRDIELQRIASALARIESGNFGYCVACDERIAGKRLDFDPSAPLCIDCASKADGA